ncbi:MAG: PhoU domain-containing protein [Candidatus Melainabacteria bacterium]|nr:PhoU domain-containing protein [Candidatus Melainabacteria bacterium]
MKTESITLIKEEVLTLGRMVETTVYEVTRLLKGDRKADLAMVERQEEEINRLCQEIEEKCVDLLMERDSFGAKEIRALVSIPLIAAKFERLADHANRVARFANWANEDEIEIPEELPKMAATVYHMVQELLLCFLTDSASKAKEILASDNTVDYLHDVLSKKLLSNLGEQESAHAQMRAQFLFCSRFLERMGDACTSIAKRVYFLSTGERIFN